MKKLALVSAAALLVLPMTPAHAAPDKTGKVVIGAPFNWTGMRTTAFNQTYWNQADAAAPPGTCGHGIQDYCETVLVEFSNPLTQAEIDAGKKSKTKSASITINNFGPTPDPVTDFDMVAFESDAQGSRGAEIQRSASFGVDQAGDESISLSITTTIGQPSVYVLVEVVYFVVIDSGFSGTARF